MQSNDLEKTQDLKKGRSTLVFYLSVLKIICELASKRNLVNPLMPGGNKKVSHT